jgi:hypothetical protein
VVATSRRRSRVSQSPLRNISRARCIVFPGGRAGH